MIAEQAVPLFLEHGAALTTRQLAEHLGIAEGTIFRAFGDKDSIIQAAIERFMDPEPLRAKLRGIDPDEPTDEKVRQVIQLLRDRLTGFIGFMSAVGMHGPPPGSKPGGDEQWLAIMSQLFRDDEVTVDVEALAFYIRLVAFGSSIPVFNDPHQFSTDELTRFVLHGVLPPVQRKKS
jgi:AcrR family transcriptional regulator